MVVLLLLLLGIGIVLGVLLRKSSGKTPPFSACKADISIASLEKIKIGGIDQWLLMRGEDTSKPVLLFLHGGPGSAEMLLVRQKLPELEKHFVVVNWDQPGAGKSYSKNIPAESMCVDSFVKYTIILTKLLCQKFNKSKIYLAAHSWGTILGIKAVKKCPEFYSAYIGIGQVVNFIEGEHISYSFALQSAKEQGIEKAIKELTEIGSPPYKNDLDISKTGIERKWISRFGADFYGKTGYSCLLPFLFNGSEYTVKDKCNFLIGIQTSLKAIWPNIQNIDFFKEAPQFEIPVFFCEGRYDYVEPSILVKRYFEQLNAPKKELLWFEHSAHNPHIEESDNFVKFLTEVVLKKTS